MLKGTGPGSLKRSNTKKGVRFSADPDTLEQAAEKVRDHLAADGDAAAATVPAVVVTEAPPVVVTPAPEDEEELQKKREVRSLWSVCLSCVCVSVFRVCLVCVCVSCQSVWLVSVYCLCLCVFYGVSCLCMPCLD